MGLRNALDARSRLVARSPEEEHRTSSPLELLFDLTFVVAISQIAAQLAHGEEAGEAARVIGSYLMVFFAIWWAWMDFTWFASGYDNDDAGFRVLTMLQMGGALVLAAGVPATFEHQDYRAITIGYFVMRVGLVFQWVRAAVEDKSHRGPALRSAVGFGALQIGWLLRLALPDGWTVPSVLVLAVLDMSVPLWASRAGQVSWHPGHIAERYGLFTIILLGESVFAATTAMQRSLEVDGVNAELVSVALAGLVLVFALWWLYYLELSEPGLTLRRDLSYVWAYGHFLLFGALAASGAGLEVAVLLAGTESAVADWAVAAAVAWPVGVFLFALWGVHAPLASHLAIDARIVLIGAAVALACPAVAVWFPPGAAIGAVAITCATVVVAASRRPEPTTGQG